MTIKLLHQMGHNSIWNKDSFEKDGVGVGLCYSPVHEVAKNINAAKKQLKETSIFDPQFYLPSSQKKKFQSYDFFPNTILGEKGFNTIDYTAISSESAKRCVDFQIKNNFEKIVIPARFYEQIHPKYIEQQSESFVIPFINYIKKIGINTKKKIILTVPITSGMLNVVEYKINILNWITSFPEISGIYFICQHDRSLKQISDASFLVDYMDTIKSTIDADLEVIVGYTNTESILYTLCGDLSLTVGAFENTRIFSLDKFIVSDEDRRGPKPRIYMPELLNWVNFEEAKLLRKQSPELWNAIYKPTKYSEDAFNATTTITFQNPLLYKHYFLTFAEQINNISKHSGNHRVAYVTSMVDQAIDNYNNIKKVFTLEKNGSDEHLIPWRNAINLFSKR
ncbi:hypothetical protein M8013_11790 [Enterobacteriaceae bacterium H4N4]|uniref:Uncharacterized protein n=1 Tax=Silvania confinis TaxID=2926470 RepID=A0A9J6QGT6_9ENTR|nr:hypothetical protein [Silvania confinis]MCU6669427.1 hypothetical protein [Silvania confinis]